jgi:hypothetical protein
MPTDLLPFSAFALESTGSVTREMGEPQTLTLCLAEMPLHADYPEQMNGTLVVSSSFDDGLLRAAVVPTAFASLTITF